MESSIIYVSYTGTTRGIAERIQKNCGGKLLEVRAPDLMSRFVAFTSRHSSSGPNSPTMPDVIDVSGSNLIVIGTPVWVGKPTPDIRKAISVLRGCEGKPVVLFATCGVNKPGKTLAILTEDVTTKGMTVLGQFIIDKTEIADSGPVENIVAKIRAAGSPPADGGA